MYANQVCEMEIIKEVFEVQKVLLEGEHQSDSVLLDSLSRLQFVDISYPTLKATMIGKTVNVLRKHGRTMQIRLLARALVTKWKRVMDVSIADGTIKKVYKKEEEEEINKPEPAAEKQLDFTRIKKLRIKPLIRKNQQSINYEKKEANKEEELLGKSEKGITENKDRAIQGMRKAPTEIGSKSKKILIQKKMLVQEDNRKALDEIEHPEKVNKALLQNKPLAQAGGTKAFNGIRPRQTSNKALIQKKELIQENKRKTLNEIDSQPKSKKPFRQEDRRKSLYEIETRQESKKALLIQDKPFLQENKLKCVDDATILEAASKRIRENYEQLENEVEKVDQVIMYANQFCEMEIIKEVFEVQKVLLEGERQSDSVLLDSLSRLQFVDISYPTLKATMIGKTVNVLRKHGRTMQIRLLARALVTKWKRVIDVSISDGTIKKVYKKEEEEEINKPYPAAEKQLDFTRIKKIRIKPLIRKNQQSINYEKKEANKEEELLGKSEKGITENKDRAIHGTRKAPTEIGSKSKKVLIQEKMLVQEDNRKALDEIGCEQNLRKVLVLKKLFAQKDMRKALNEIEHQEKVNKALVQKKPLAQAGGTKAFNGIRPRQTSNKALIQKKELVQENKRKTLNEIDSQPKSKKPFLQEDRRKSLSEIETRQESKKALLIQNKPFLQEDRLKCVDDATRLEAASKRIQENYEQLENAKRQRRIKVMELHNLPNGALRQTKPCMKRKGVSTKPSCMYL